MANYLISGLSGTGKSSVCAEFKRRGYKAVESDEVFGYYGDPKTGLPAPRHQLNWIWDKKKVDEVLLNANDGDIFVCGGSMNESDFKSYFKKSFTLYVDDATLEQRLLTRTNNNFGKHPEDLARQLDWNKGTVEYAISRGRIPVDATRPLAEVVDDILKQIKL